MLKKTLSSTIAGLLIIGSGIAVGNTVIDGWDSDHYPTDIPWGRAIFGLSSTGDSLNATYRDNKTDGHCVFVRTRRGRSSNYIEHGQNCNTGRWKDVSHYVGGDGGGVRLCRSGHWNCTRWHEKF